MSARRGTVPVRGYALTPWSRALVDVTEGRFAGDGTDAAVDSRKITKRAGTSAIGTCIG